MSTDKLNQTMTPLANAVRTLSGDTGAKGVETMTSDINTANTDIASQATLIAQIQTALEGKAGGSGGSAGDPSLPSGYVRTGYIQFNAAQTVDTSIVCNQDTKIKCIFTRDTDTAMYMYGVVNNGNTASITAYLSSSGSWRFGGTSASRAITVNEDLIHTAIVSKTGIVAVNPNNTFTSVSDFETIGSLVIGAVRNADGSIGTAQYIGKILSFIMWQGDSEVLHLSPVVSTNGVYRFYDEVSGNFFDSITDVPLDGGNL